MTTGHGHMLEHPTAPRAPRWEGRNRHMKRPTSEESSATWGCRQMDRQATQSHPAVRRLVSSGKILQNHVRGQKCSRSTSDNRQKWKSPKHPSVNEWVWKCDPFRQLNIMHSSENIVSG